MKKFGKVVAVMMTAIMVLSGCGATSGDSNASGDSNKVVVGTNAE